MKISFKNSYSLNKLLLIIFLFIAATPVVNHFWKLLAVVVISLIVRDLSGIKKEDLPKILSLVILIITISVYNDLQYTGAGEISYFVLYPVLLMVFSYLFATRYSLTEILLGNEHLVAISLVFGLPLFFVSLLYPSVINLGLDYSIGDTDVHKSFILLNFHLNGGGSTERFVGFGPEPGFTQMFFVLAFYSRYTRKQKIDLNLVLIIVGIILTKSTAGLICFFVVMCHFFGSFRLRGIVMVSLIIVLILPEIEFHLDNKVIGSESFSSRFSRYNLTYEIYNFIDILFGRGDLFYRDFLKPNDFGGFDSILQIVQRYGFVVVFAILLMLRQAVNLLILLIVTVSLFSQVIWLSAVFWIIIFNNKKREKNIYC